MEPVSEKPPKPPRSDGFIRNAGMATQMAVTIGLGVWAGLSLDERFPNRMHLWTLTLSLLSVGVAMYLAIRDLNRQ